MVDYKIVKECGICRTRFVVPKAEARRRYCDVCQKKVDKKEFEE